MFRLFTVSEQQRTLPLTIMASITWFLLILVAATSAAPVQEQRQAVEKAVPGQGKPFNLLCLIYNKEY